MLKVISWNKYESNECLLNEGTFIPMPSTIPLLPFADWFWIQISEECFGAVNSEIESKTKSIANWAAIGMEWCRNQAIQTFSFN